MQISLDSGLTLQLGDHSYIHGQKIHNPSGALTHVAIGKFCSIATHLTIIGYDHHSEWITMFPFLDDAHRASWPGTTGIPYPQEPRFGSNKSRGDISIGNDVWIGYDVKLFKGITIGNGAVIGACSLVNKSVEPYTIVAGTPARPIRKRFSDPEIAALERLRWWDWPAEMINRYLPQLCSSKIVELEKMLEGDPAFMQIEARARAEEFLAQADAAYAHNDLKTAREALKQALLLDPDSTPLIVCLGNVQFQLGEFTDALHSFQRADEEKPDDSDILVRLANTACRCQEFPLFERSLKRALEIDPKNLNALRLAAGRNLQDERFAEAAEQYCALLEADPRDASLWLQLGKCLGEIKDTASSRWCFEHVLELDPANDLAKQALQHSAAPDHARFRVAVEATAAAIQSAH